MSRTLLPFAFVKVGRHRMVKMIDPERIDWRYGFFGLGLPEQRPIERFSAFEEWCARAIPTDEFSNLAVIFHVSRCGSTLLAQNLKATGRAVVLSEPPFLRILRGRIHDTISPQTALRGVVRAISDWLVWAEGKGSRLIIKLNSQAHFLREELMSALPNARHLFLHREPTPVMESILRGPPPYLEREGSRSRFAIPADLAAIEEDPVLLAAASRYSAALDAFAGIRRPDLMHVAYPELAERFEHVCDHLGVGPANTSSWQAAFNAKSFDPDRDEAYQPIAEERLAVFSKEHRKLLDVIERRYNSFLQTIGG